MTKINQQFGLEIPEITSDQINEKITPVLRKMEQTGIRIDRDALEQLEKKLSLRLKELEVEIFKLAGFEFNIASPSQIADVLFVKLNIPTNDLKRTKTGVSTAASELNKIAALNPIIPLILEHRELSKLISTYLQPLPLLVDENNRLHTNYGLETNTGRLNSTNPNLQNIPIKGTYGPEIRKAFVATPGYKLICADYSQIELRIVAAISNDKAMLEAFKNGVDIHTKTAAEILDIPETKVTADHRRIAKVVNFGIIYGVSPYGLAQQTGLDVAVAAEYIMKYFHNHPGIKKYMEEMIAFAHKNGYVETLFGAKRTLPNINSRNHYLAEADERMAINTPIQGTAAELLKLAMIELDQQFASKYKEKEAPRMLLTVHDEIVVEAPEKIATEVSVIVKEAMEEVLKLPVPITVSLSIGDNWAEAK